MNASRTSAPPRLSHCVPLLAALIGATALLSALPGAAFAGSLKDLGQSLLARGEESPRLREAREHLLHGKPEQVEALLGDAALAKLATERGKPALRRRTPSESALLAEALLQLGRAAQARKVVKACTSHADCGLLAGQIELATGTRKDAVRLLTLALKRHPKDLRVRVALGEALLSVGRPYEARQMLDPIADWYQEGGLKTVPQMIAVARSLALNGFFKDASTVMAEASEAAAEPSERLAVEAAWGQLFLSKYNFRDADEAFAKVLAINPRHVATVVGMARIDLDSDHDIHGARKRLDALLALRPLATAALVLRAEVALHDEDYKAAQGYLDRALKQSPDDAAALAVKAAACKLADDAACFDQTEKRALKSNPHDGDLYLVTATYLEMAHRYREVLLLLGVALKKNPDLWQAHAALGMGYARMADDAQARKHLEIAFTNDPYNVRTANVLNVLYDGVLKHMHLLKGEHVDLRVHRRDRKALERTMLPFLQESYEELAKKYKMEANKPLQIEIFPTTEQFSVRTVGLPRLGAHAVCFGHLITSRSPAERPFNWKMVLHHEMSHVFHIQATDGRVPRWLTEGVAMMESAWKDERWHIVAERRAWERLKAGELTPVARFNLAFSQARSMNAIVEAYYQAMLLVRFLEETWGFEKIRQLMLGYGKGEQTAALIQKHYGVAPAELDRRFFAWLGKRLARFDKDFRPTPESVARRLKTEWKTPTPAREALARALAALREGHPRVAREALEQALAPPRRGLDAVAGAPLPQGTAVSPAAGPAPASGASAADQGGDSAYTTPEQCAAGFFLMELGVAERNWPQAAQFARRLVEAADGACDGVQQRLVLARAVHDPKELATLALPHIQRALAIDARDPAPLAMWLDAAIKQGDLAAQRQAARQLVALDPNSTRAPELLARVAWTELAADLGLPAPGATGSAAQPAPGANSAKTPSPKAGGLAPAVKAALVADLQRGATALEEVDPTGRAAVLFEARLAVAQGQPKMALPVYREAARRSEGDAARAECWCELAVVAARANAADDKAEAERRCKAERGQL